MKVLISCVFSILVILSFFLSKDEVARRSIASVNRPNSCLEAISEFVNFGTDPKYDTKTAQIMRYLKDKYKGINLSYIHRSGLDRKIEDGHLVFTTLRGNRKIPLNQQHLIKADKIKATTPLSQLSDYHQKQYENNISKLYKYQNDISTIIYEAHKKDEKEVTDYLLGEYQRINTLIKFYRGELDYVPYAQLGDNSYKLHEPVHIDSHGRTRTLVHFDNSTSTSNSIFDISANESEEISYQTMFANFLNSLNYNQNFFTAQRGVKKVQSFTYMNDNEVKASFHMIDAIRDYESRPELVNTVRDFLFNEYKNRLNIEDQDLDKLKEITEQLEGRTIVLAAARNSNMKYSFKGYDDSGIRYLSRQKDEIDISGTISITLSKEVDQKLPLEIFTGHEVERRRGEIIAEIGRFAVDGNDSIFNANDLIAAVTFAAQKVEGLDRIVIEADKIRARSFKRWGFKPIHERINYEGNTEYIMEVTPKELLESVEKRYFESL
ncbi:hypothetical protein ABMA79_03770 [Halobacteriovorax sp. HFRX-2_2]|uniref:N-acyl amino acid synthase FeeM domain-containing protein n=1 Tax=unclassified Halobacteriovorax TaxID=2639665 RepID=UPI0037117628